MDKFFKLKEHGTNVRTEIIAGLTTFVTMAYIIFVNPNTLGKAGMSWDGVFIATILAAVIGTLIMGLVANVPYAQAPGMGLNAFFTYTVCLGMGFSWNQALGIVFICGLINILITVTQIRKMIIKAIPVSLQYAISGGIGLFIAYIGLKEAHLLSFTAEETSLVTSIGKGGVFKDIIPAISNFTDPVTILALIGLVIIVVLMLLKIRGSILIGIISTTIIGIIMQKVGLFGDVTLINIPEASKIVSVPAGFSETFLKLDVFGLFSDPTKITLVLTTILAFSLSDTFDTIGTFLGTGRKSGIFDNKDEEALQSGKGFKSKLDRALFADATATSVGALLGTSNTTTYVESASGIAAGGRTGLTSVVVAVLFLLCLPFSSVAGMVPAAATAPALIVVGILMMESIAKVKWDDFEDAAAAFFTAVIMPFTYSISNGVAVGFTFYVLTKIVKGKAKDVHPIMYIVTLLFIANFIIGAL